MVRLWVHVWARKAYDQAPTIELDWTEHFDRRSRRLPAAHVWSDVIFKELAAAKGAIARIPGGSYIDLRGQIPRSVITAIGWELSEAAGYSFRVEQPTVGQTTPWRSNAGASSRHLVVFEESHDLAGEDLLLVLSITGDAMPAVRGFLKTLEQRFRAVVHAMPDNGASERSLTSAQDAVALAFRAKEILKDQRGELGVRRTHLILYAPAAFCLFLGQRLNAVGEVVLYEQTSDGGYQVAVALQT